MNDPYVKQARQDGYRCRSAYKLLQINQKLDNKLLLPGHVVLDCGCSPGAWSQVASMAINSGGIYNSCEPAGSLIGCDLLNVEPVPGAHLFSHSDFTLEKVQQRIVQVTGGRPIDVILSDMAPNAMGDGRTDHQRIVQLVYKVLEFALQHSAKGGALVCKIWDGALTKKLLTDIECHYKKTRHIKPKASRSESGELYVVGLSFVGKNKAITMDHHHDKDETT